jgi:hypothetical protein
VKGANVLAPEQFGQSSLAHQFHRALYVVFALEKVQNLGESAAVVRVYRLHGFMDGRDLALEKRTPILASLLQRLHHQILDFFEKLRELG